MTPTTISALKSQRAGLPSTIALWYDANLNGLQDANNSGIDGVVFKSSDSSGNSELDANGNPITVITANGGYYQFVVPCGSY